MPAPSWDLDPDRLRANPQQIAEVEARIRAVPPDQRSHYQLAQRGIDIPPGYRLERDGRLKYVAVDNSRPFYLDPKFAIPAIASAGLTLPYVLPGSAVASGAGVGAYGTGAGLNAATNFASQAASPLLSGGSLAGTAAASGAGAAIPTIASRTIGNGMGRGPASLAGTSALAATGGKGVWDWIKDRGRDALTGGDDEGDDDDRFGGDEIKKLIATVIAAMAARDAFSGDRQTSPEERVQHDRINRNLAQQEQRTQFQNPLYEAVTRMAFGLLPTMGNNGQPYPLHSLSDVKIPGYNDQESA